MGKVDEIWKLIGNFVYDSNWPGTDEHKASREKLRASLSACVAEWQGMESAPQDGTPVILGYVGCAAEGFWMGDSTKNHWGETGWFDSDSDILCDHPHHPIAWQPLPTPPEAPNE